MALDFSKMRSSKTQSSQQETQSPENTSGDVSESTREELPKDFPEKLPKDFKNFLKTSETSNSSENTGRGFYDDIQSDTAEETDDNAEEFYEDSDDEDNNENTDEIDSDNSDEDDTAGEDSLYEIYIDEDSYQPDPDEYFSNSDDFDIDDNQYYVPNFMSEDEEYIIPENSEISRAFKNSEISENTENFEKTSERTFEKDFEKSLENSSENVSENVTDDEENSKPEKNSSTTFDDLTNQLLYGDDEDIENIPYIEKTSHNEFNDGSKKESDIEKTNKNISIEHSYKPDNDEKILETDSEKFAKRSAYKNDTKEINRIKRQKKADEKRVFNPKASMEKTLTRSVEISKDGVPTMFLKDLKTSKNISETSRNSEMNNSGSKIKKKLTKKEINNFSNFYINERRTDSEKDLVSLLKKPYGMKETSKEKSIRERRIKAALSDETIFQEGNKFNFTDRDKEILEFLAIFKYATSRQLSYIKGNAEVTVARRLSKMMQKGLVKKKTIYGAKPIWFNTKLGMTLSGYDLPHVTDQRISLSLMQHQFVVNHVAANLWGANMNVLDESDLPQANRINNKGERELGEMLASETEINSNFSREKAFQGSADYKKRLMNKRDSSFEKWRRDGLEEGEYPPPFELGNEWMWAVIPPYKPGLDAYHVPDLIVKRPSRKDGSPRSIAVEIELKNKSPRSYEKVLKAYRTDILLYDKVIWVCHKLSSARKLEKIAKDLGMHQTGQVKVIPIITENGPYTRGDLWSL